MSGLDTFMQAPNATIEVADDFDEINRIFRERGWSDGLPIVPPTAARVEKMLAYCDRPWHEAIGKVGPRYGEATPARIAVSAVMAGAEPRYFPLIMLAIEAMCEKRFNLYGVQATTHNAAPLMIFNGPIAREVGINSGHNAFGPGAQANATIGRAVRLALVNIGGAFPTIGDMCTYGSPAKYTYCAAENEAANPWEPLHVERGYDINDTTVTVVGAECPHNINDHESITAEGVLQTIAGSRFVGTFSEVVRKWEKTLNIVAECLEIWFTVQRKWQYLESIFIGAEDIRMQLPEEAKRFDAIDKIFRCRHSSTLLLKWLI
jgi:hypothetical protein